MFLGPHITDDHFDRLVTPQAYHEHIEQFLLTKTLQNGFDLPIVLREAYESMYGICDHETVGRTKPLSLVAYHPRENVNRYNSLYSFIERFAESGIGGLFNISLIEALQLPRDIYQRMIEVAIRSPRESAQSKKVLKQLDRLM